MHSKFIACHLHLLTTHPLPTLASFPPLLLAIQNVGKPCLRPHFSMYHDRTSIPFIHSLNRSALLVLHCVVPPWTPPSRLCWTASGVAFISFLQRRSHNPQFITSLVTSVLCRTLTVLSSSPHALPRPSSRTIQHFLFTQQWRAGLLASNSSIGWLSDRGAFTARDHSPMHQTHGRPLPHSYNRAAL